MFRLPIINGFSSSVSGPLGWPTGTADAAWPCANNGITSAKSSARTTIERNNLPAILDLLLLFNHLILNRLTVATRLRICLFDNYYSTLKLIDSKHVQNLTRTVPSCNRAILT